MNITELRIGSIIDQKKYINNILMPIGMPIKIHTIEPFKVTACGINENFATCKEFKEFDVNDISPIPLDKNWFVKFGFVRDTNVGVWFGNKYGNYRFAIFDSHDGNYKFNIEMPSTNIIIKYVHQLQNLHLAITGDELKII